MSKVFVLEDDAQAMEIVDFLESRGHDVVHAEELNSAIYFLEHEPGLAAMDKLLFDLAVPKCESEHWQGEPRVSEYAGKYAGLDYIADNYKHWPAFRQAVDGGRVAILTAHDNAMQEDFEQKLKADPGLVKVKIISKLANNMDEQLIDFLRGK